MRLDIIKAVAADGRPTRLWYHDEARFGLHLPCYRRLTARGVKPVQPYEPLYEYSWLYAAVEPNSGESFFLQLPRLDAECFELFLAELSSEAPEALNVLVLDNAPAHVKRSLVLPENIVLLWLPPYSPELNPVERLWLAIRQKIDCFNHSIRSSIDALEEHIAVIIRALTPSQIASLTGYDYIRQALSGL
jgi:transposase